MKPKVLIAEPRDFSPRALELLRTRCDVELREVKPGELGGAVAGVDVLWLRLAHRVDAAVLAQAKRLKVVATPVTGLDHVDLAACERRGVKVAALKGETEFLKTVRATAELTVGLTLALIRQLPRASASVLEGKWDRDSFRGKELYGKTAGIVGVGRLGSIVAGYLQSFGMKVKGFDKRSDFPSGVERCDALKKMLAECDLVSVHLSLDDTTRGFFGAGAFEAMKPGAWLVNTSRGGVVDEAALLSALRSGRLAGAALDVLSGEPNVDAKHPVVQYAREHANVLVVPHIGGNTEESFEKTELFLANKVLAALEAGPEQPRAKAPTRVLGIVPARAGSKRVPRKNVRPMGGRPMVAWAIDALKNARGITECLVSSDSDEVLEAARQAGVRALRRPPELASDTSPAIDYVRHALDTLAKEGVAPFDAICIAQASSPLTTSADIEATLALMKEHPEADSAVSVMEVEHATHPVKLKRLEGTQLVPFLEEERGRMAAHQLPKLYVRNCAVYVSMMRTIERGEIVGESSYGHVMPRERSVDINDELDFQFAQFLFDKKARGA